MLEGEAARGRLARLVEANRSSRSHDLNERSSRSHCIVRVFLTQRESGKARSGSQTSKFLFVDLAGSERIGKSGVSGAGRQEAIKINKSLTALGRVVKALTRKETHVPYRKSLLTVLLKDSLSGRSVMGVVICVASEPSHVEETICSLRYGARLARVKSSPVAAVESNTEEEEAFYGRMQTDFYAQEGETRVGLAFLDAQACQAWACEFPDDEGFSLLEAALLQAGVRELALCEDAVRGAVGEGAVQRLRQTLAGCGVLATGAARADFAAGGGTVGVALAFPAAVRITGAPDVIVPSATKSVLF